MSAEPTSTAVPHPPPVLATGEKTDATSVSESPAALDPQPAVVGAPLETQAAALNSNQDSAPKTEANPTVAPTEVAPTPLAKLFLELPIAIAEAEHAEMWGVYLTNEKDVPTTIVLEKFLRANKNDVAAAKAQLTAALKWRKSVNPAKLLADMEFDAAKFGGLGYVTVYPKTETHAKEIVTWNIYGGVKDLKSTFGNVDDFVKWRAALMELSVKQLDLASATVPIPTDGVDQYRMIQVHDYLSVSFFRMDPAVKAASKETIQIFSMAYPELLKDKFFVNVPVIMGWVFAAMKVFLSAETVRKFHPLSYGSALAAELKSFGAELPTVYGGKGKPVTEGLTVKYSAPVVAAAQPEAVAVDEAKVAEAKE